MDLNTLPETPFEDAKKVLRIASERFAIRRQVRHPEVSANDGMTLTMLCWRSMAAGPRRSSPKSYAA